jgi:hypothetical protein
MATSSKGVSALKLKAWLGISYKTAWFLRHRVREMLADGSAEKLTGIVEADETHIGGRKRKGRDDREDQTKSVSHRGRGRARSTVLVAVQRKGRTKARRVASHGVDDIAPRIFAWVSPDAILSTDELPAYRWIGRMLRGHARVHHASGQYARDDARRGIPAHVNTVESFNSQIKRAIIGVWHWFSAKHCDRHLTEIAFRWNNRKADFDSRVDLALVTGKRLFWKGLVG